MLLSYLFDSIFIIYILMAGWLAFILFKKKKRIIPALLMVSVLGLIYSAYLEPYWVKTRYETFNIGKLNQEIKVVLVSDWHVRPGKRAGFVRSAAKKITRQQPDLILMAGDHLFYDDFEKFKTDLAALGALAKIAPTYAVLGNHDHGIGNRGNTVHYADQSANIAQVLTENGVKVLLDAKEKVKIRGEEFWLVGFDEFWHWNKKPAQAVEGLAGDNSLKIGVSHNPDAAFTAEGQVLDLVLSGHTHGGQIRLPFLGPLGNAETDLPFSDYGRYLASHQPKILNTVGIGESGPHLRFLNRPEFAVLTIK